MYSFKPNGALITSPSLLVLVLLSMAFVPPDPNVFYPIPPGQLPPGFVPPPPGTAVRGIPIVVPLGLEMLISPEGFPVFVPERSSVPPPPYAPSPPSLPNSSPGIPQQKQYYQHQSTTPVPPSRQSTISSQHSSHHHFTPPPPTPPGPMPPVPTTPPSQLPGILPYQMPVPDPQFQRPPMHPTSPSHHALLSPTTPNHAFAPPLSHAPLPPLPIHTQATPMPAPAIPVGLTFASIVTSFRTSSESGSAWMFYSLGLVHNPGQKEIAITLRQRPGQYSLETVQPIMYNLYQQMDTHIKVHGGKPLTAGEVFPCRLTTPNAGTLDMAILLVHAPPECKASLENKDVLYGLMATLEEMAVFLKHGAARTLTNMGNDLETWPIPLWSDWSRPSLITLHDFEGSLTERISVLKTKNIVATLDTISHRLTLVVSSTALELIQVDLQKFPPAQPMHVVGFGSDVTRVSFWLDLDAGAQAYLTWRTGQDGPAIFNARPNPTSFHGCWMTLSGIGQHEEATVQEGVAAREDGIEVRMRASTWERLYQALISKTPAVVPVGSETVQLNYA